VDFHAEGRDVLLFEFSRHVALDKGCFADSAIADQNELEIGSPGSLRGLKRCGGFKRDDK
jgi:hypothetical protein